jgi:hypothetical protein
LVEGKVEIWEEVEGVLGNEVVVGWLGGGRRKEGNVVARIEPAEVEEVERTDGRAVVDDASVDAGFSEEGEEVKIGRDGEGGEGGVVEVGSRLIGG